MKKVHYLAIAVALCACRNPPSVGATSNPAPSSPQPPPAPAPPHSPLTATFIDLKSEGADIVLRTCDELFVAVVSGRSDILSIKLAEGDLGIFRRRSTITVAGEGLAVIAVLATDPCVVDASLAASTVVRGGEKRPLSWAKDQMQAHLDAEADVSPNVYAGRLAGYEGVAEHAHVGSWEVLCAADANGTYAIDSVTKTLHARQVVVIPPGVKHAWQPVAGSYLQAVQFYVPPGPEQRFKTFAARPSE